MTTPRHVPVLLDRVVALLAPALDHSDAVLVDATLGLGGHSEAVLARCELARVVGIDRDPRALELSRERLAPYGDRFTGGARRLRRDPRRARRPRARRVDGVLFDLGVSSMQLDLPERGFAYAVDAPLDMRMDASTGHGPTAADVLNTYDAGELTRVLREYGEERLRQADRGRDRARAGPRAVHHLGRLVALLYDVIPAPARRTGGHPAKRTFQALRMEVNDELRCCERAMPAAIDAIGVGGRVVVESYHSLEDRLVKRAFTAAQPQRRARGPAVRARGPRAGAAARDPRRRAGQRRTRSLRTPAPPRAAARHRTSPTPTPAREPPEMSSTAAQVARAAPADRRGRRQARPAHGRPAAADPAAAPRVPFVTLVSLMLLGGVVGLLMFNTSMQQASFRAARARAAGRRPDGPARRRSRWSSRSCATRSGSHAKAQQMDMVLPAGGPLVIAQAAARSSATPGQTRAPGIPAAADRSPVRGGRRRSTRARPGRAVTTGPTTGSQPHGAPNGERRR